MSHVKKGFLTCYPDWAKHLRKEGKKQFWRGERNAGRRMIRTELDMAYSQSNTEQNTLGSK